LMTPMFFDKRIAQSLFAHKFILLKHVIVFVKRRSKNY